MSFSFSPDFFFFFFSSLTLSQRTILVNEIAPPAQLRAHYTIETHATSQYGPTSAPCSASPSRRPPSEFRTPRPNAIMLIYSRPGTDVSHGGLQLALETPGATLHLYGKQDARKGRKMGHVTVVSGSISTAEATSKNSSTRSTILHPRSPKGRGSTNILPISNNNQNYRSAVRKKRRPRS